MDGHPSKDVDLKQCDKPFISSTSVAMDHDYQVVSAGYRENRTTMMMAAGGAVSDNLESRLTKDASTLMVSPCTF